MRLTAALGVLLVAGGTAAAHELRPSFLEIRETAPGVFASSLRVSTAGASRVHLAARFPDGCRDAAPAIATAAADAEVGRRTVACDGPLGGATIRIDGLAGSLNEVIVRVETLDGTVQAARVLPEAPSFVVAARPDRLDVVRSYGSLGVEHILFGFDHLLFVLALLLLIREPRALFATITAFTLAHSITLALAALGLARAPPLVVEPLIALSIVLVAAEVVKGRHGRGLAPWQVAFAFGLLHGLGFGRALAEIGLPAGEVPVALLVFNLGVEAGQLLVVAVVLLAAALVRRVVADRLVPTRRALAYGVGVIAAFWFAERAGELFATGYAAAAASLS